MADTVYISDGDVSFIGGQNASKNPDLVPESTVYAAVNATFKNGIWGPRDGLYRHELIFPEGGISIGGKLATPYKRVFEEGKFQGTMPYMIGNTSYIQVTVSGIVFLINEDTLEVSVLDFLLGQSLNEFTDRHNWSYASRFNVIFDYPSFPAILENLTIRRANPALYEVPISTHGAYNQSRLFVSNAGNEWTGGDPTNSVATPDAPITFEEVFAPGAAFLNQIFQLPTNYYNDPITAMGFLQLVDTSTGIGPLIIATANQIFAANTQNPRASWEAGQFVQCIVNNTGIAGQRAMTNLNSDLFFASTDGQIHTLNMSRGEQGKWSKTPISKEVKNWLVLNEPNLVKYYALCYFNDKIFCTANPYRTIAKTLEGKPIEDYAFGGMVALELDNVSTLGQDSPPVWAGLWTGIRPMDFCVTGKRCFVLSKDNDRINSLWEILPGTTVDKADKKQRLIKSKLYTRNYVFKDPTAYKNMIYGNFPFQEVRGKFKFKVSFKSSHFANFLPWREFKHFAPNEVCSIPGCLNGLASHNFSQLKFGTLPTSGCDPVTKIQNDVFTKVQLKLEAEGGYWELPMALLKAKVLPDSDTNTNCAGFTPAAVCLNCNNDWEINPFQTCE